MPQMTNRKIAPRHLQPVRRQLALVRRPLLVVRLALQPALLALRDAHERVDDANEQQDAADAGGDGDLGGLGQAGPFLFGFLLGGFLVEGFVDFRFASVGGQGLVGDGGFGWGEGSAYSFTWMLAWLPEVSE